MSLARYLVLPAFLAIAMPASAELYRSADASGEVRITDDITSVPKEQRPATPVIHDRKESAVEGTTTSKPEAPDGQDGKTVPPEAQPGLPESTAAAAEKTDPFADLLVQKKALEAQRAEIDAEYKAVLQRKEEVLGEEGSNRRNSAFVAHHERLREINADIKELEQKQEALNRQIDDFNNRLLEQMRQSIEEKKGPAR